jgi:glycerol-3-phosphate dehydrogenase
VNGERFDVAVIGGGIIGCGIARDAALRGLRVALFEKQDFGSGTTAASTRIVHGGLRYLEMLDFRLVRLDLRERETLLRIAPHLVKPLEFVIPFFRGHVGSALKMRVGLALYDALSYDTQLPSRRRPRYGSRPRTRGHHRGGRLPRCACRFPRAAGARKHSRRGTAPGAGPQLLRGHVARDAGRRHDGSRARRAG